MLQGQGDGVRGYGAFAQDLPLSVFAGKVDDGSRHAPSGRTTVDDELDVLADLVAHAAGIGAFGQAGQVGGSCGDGQAQGLDNSARDGGVWNAQGDVAGV